jgi:hypothetical protein
MWVLTENSIYNLAVLFCNADPIVRCITCFLGHFSVLSDI